MASVGEIGSAIGTRASDVAKGLGDMLGFGGDTAGAMSTFTPGLAMDGTGSIVSNVGGGLGGTVTDYLGNAVTNSATGLGQLNTAGTTGFADMFKTIGAPLVSGYNTWDANQETKANNALQFARQTDIDAFNQNVIEEDRALATKRDVDMGNLALGYTGQAPMTGQQAYDKSGAGALAAQNTAADLYA